MQDRRSPLFVAKALVAEKFSEAAAVFFAGSVVRGEASQFSDIDIVVVYDSIENAYRESFVYKDWPVEVFVHDMETIRYFLEVYDRDNGLPELHQMLIEALVLPEENDLSKELKDKAAKIFESGPPALEESQINLRKYRISEILNDAKSPRGRDELLATLSKFYQEFTDFYFRSQGLWSARGKAIPKRMKKIDSEFYKIFSSSYRKAVESGDVGHLVQACESFMGHPGGYFEGFREDAPSDWRIKS